jgi:hypothetical protein
MSRAADTRGERIIHWIEEFCLYPTGPEKGQRVKLTRAQKESLRKIYDSPDGRKPAAAIARPLGLTSCFTTSADIWRHSASRHQHLIATP